jgi:mRNA-degrading endonuclease RelE of RelBE toxin-antitoxin system
MMVLPYEMNFEGRVEKILKRMAKKDKARYFLILERLKQVREDPVRFKPLKVPMSSYRRAHVDSLVILYLIDEALHKVFVIDVCHHDDAY